jgi:hypothetical protein
MLDLLRVTPLAGLILFSQNKPQKISLKNKRLLDDYMSTSILLDDYMFTSILLGTLGSVGK